MLTLAFDTSSPVLTVAVGEGDKIISEVTTWLPRGHMAELIPIIDDLLKQADQQINDVEAIVVGTGPGSYTGLRIGIVIARTLAQMLDIPIVGLPSADAIAYHNLEDTGITCPIIDAKRGEVYTSFYCTRGMEMQRLTDFRAVDPEELAKALKIEEFDRVVLAGDAVKLYGEIFKRVIGDTLKVAPEEDWWPKAADLVQLAYPRLIRKEYDELYQLAPLYVRLSQAEEMWEQRHRR